MNKPTVADNKPIAVELNAGEEYYFCACGKSSNQPFCDGSHKGTGFTPKTFTAEESGDAYLCNCKQSANQPFCDGKHAQVPADKVGKEFALQNDKADAAPQATPTPEEPTVAFIHKLASAQFGYNEESLKKVQAFHFKGGQGAKTGTGGHLPASKNVGRISEVRGIPEGQAAVSPPTFADLTTPADFARFADRVREISGGIPVGFDPER
ncbi:MAG: CDGSH-type Zn-finger protein [Candidatus Pelagisphaera sp.]|jgi:CDGSH-type Zn-finger protein